MEFNTRHPSPNPLINRTTSQHTDILDEIPSRLQYYKRAFDKLPTTSLSTLKRLIYKNMNQHGKFIAFKKIILIKRLFTRLSFLHPSQLLDTFHGHMFDSTLFPIKVDTCLWSLLPSIEYQEHCIWQSLSSYTLLVYLQTALLDGFRYARQEIEKQLFIPVYLTFMATLSKLYVDSIHTIQLYCGLYSLQRQILKVSGCRPLNYTLRLEDMHAGYNADTTSEMNDHVIVEEGDEEKVIVDEMREIHDRFWSKVELGVNDKDDHEEVKRNASEQEILTLSSSRSKSEQETLTLSSIRLKGKKKKATTNEIDSIFDAFL